MKPRPEIYSHKMFYVDPETKLPVITKITQTIFNPKTPSESTWQQIDEITPVFESVPWADLVKIVEVFGWHELGRNGYDYMAKQYNAWNRKHNLQNEYRAEMPR